MTIPVSICGKTLDAVLDTGAERTLINKHWIADLGLHILDSPPVAVTGALSQSISSAQEAVLPLYIGDTKFLHTALFTDISNDLLLGADFISTHKCVIDLGTETLTVGDTLAPLTIQRRGSAANEQCGDLVVRQAAIVPAWSTKIIGCKFPPQTEKYVMISPSDSLPENFTFVDGICVADEESFVRIYNLTNDDMSLPRGYVLGSAAPVGLVTNSDNDSPSSVCRVHLQNEVIKEADIVNSDSRASDSSSDADGVTGGVISDAPRSSPVSGSLPSVPEHLTDLYTSSCEGLAPDECLKLASLLTEFSDVFCKDDYDLGEFTHISHSIDTGDAKPIRQPMRRTPLGFQDEEENHIQKMLDFGIIEPSCSDWASPPVLIRKKDKSVRYCLDYRSLNTVTVKDAYPLPRIEECLDTLQGSQFYSTLDLASGYWQILIDPKDKHKTAFITKFGLYQYIRMAFGLCNAPATFQRVMCCVLLGLTWKSVIAYLDDVIVLGKSFSENLVHLTEVLERFRIHHLKLKPKKCHLFRRSVEFLGRLVNPEGIQITDTKLQTIRDWPIPTNKKEVQTFLGFMNYHREFIPQFSSIANPLYQLTRKQVPFSWSTDQQSSFKSLIDIALSSSVLSYPNDKDSFILDTDASDQGIGAVLLQVQNGQERPICYASKILKAAQRQYCTTRKELLAVVAFTRQFRHYLLGRRFTIRTDHASLLWLTRFRNPQGQLARWLEELSLYDFQLVHRAGALHCNADALSRIAYSEIPCPHLDTKPLSDLPCGGCKYCTRVSEQWKQFEDVDDVIPISVRQVHLDSGDVVTPGYSPEEIRQAQKSDSDLKLVCDWYARAPKTGEGGDVIAVDVDIDVVRPNVGIPASGIVENIVDIDVARPNVGVPASGIPTRPITGVPSAPVAPLVEPEVAWSPPDDEYMLASPAVKQLWSMRSQLRLVDDILYYQWIGVGTSKLRLIVPESLRADVLSVCHDSKTAGHYGTDKTFSRVSSGFYWPGMRSTVRLHVQTCTACNTNKKIGRRNRARLLNYHAGAPMERVHIDILGPFMDSNRGHKYILMIVDQFTKWVECCAIPNQSAETVCRHMVDQFISRFGTPTIIHSDQGRNFVSDLFTGVCALLDIVKTRTTPYRPSSNGQVERYNLTLMNAVRCFIRGEYRDWDLHLPVLAMALRSVPNRMTGYSPNYMMLGREISMPDSLFGVGKVNEVLRDAPSYLQELQRNLSRAHDAARDTLQENLVRQKSYHDRRLHERQFEPGDLVYKLDTSTKIGLSAKLKPVYIGPYLVTAVRSPVLYQVEGRRKTHVLHHDRLRLCIDRDIPLWIRRKRHDYMFTADPTSLVDVETDLNLSTLFQDGNTVATSVTRDQPDAPLALPMDVTTTGDIPNTTLLPVPSMTETRDRIAPVSPSRVVPPTRSGRTRRLPRHLTDYEL